MKLPPRHDINVFLHVDILKSVAGAAGRNPKATALEIALSLSRVTEEWIRYAIKDESGEEK